MFHPANQPHFSLAIEGLEHDLQVLAFEGREALNEPYRFVIDLVSEDDRLDVDALLHKLAFLEFSPDGDGIHGQLMEVAEGKPGRRRTHYQAVLVPRLAYLDLRHNTRIFQRRTVQDIIEQVLKEHGILANAVKFQFGPSVYAPREYCTQYNESDLQFLNRLCEEEGFHYHWRHSPNGHLLVFGDDQSVFLKLRELGYQPDSGMVAEEPVIKRFGLRLAARTSRVSRRDYSFEKPFLQLEADAIQQPAPVEPDLEDYAYPGRFSDRRDGQRLSQRALERHRTDQCLASGDSDQPALHSGYLLPLHGYPLAKLNDLWLLTEVLHQGRQPQVLEEDIDSYAPADGFYQGYRNRFTGSFWNVPYRPPLKHPKPFPGTQTAIVTGPEGEEIHCDEYGRIRVQFHWDRDGKRNDQSSCWLRVAHAWTGPGYGALMLPRVGMEVRVIFLDDDPDRPLVNHCLYHGENLPPYPLPANKTRTVFKTLSSPGGNGFNELRIEDKAGQEHIHVQAQRDLEFLVGNDQTLQVEGERSETIEGNSVHAFEAEQHLSLSGPRKTRLDADDHLSVAGNSHQQVGQVLAVEAGQEIHLSSGQKIVMHAGSTLCLQAGGHYLVLCAGGIFSSVPIQPGGAPLPGTPADPSPPDEAVQLKGSQPDALKARQRPGQPSANAVAPSSDTDHGFDIRLQDAPGNEGFALAHTPWSLLQGDDDTPLAQGESDAQGRVALDDAQRRLLLERHAQTPRGIWLAYAGQRIRLDLHREREDWSAERHALGALDFHDPRVMQTASFAQDSERARLDSHCPSDLYTHLQAKE